MKTFTRTTVVSQHGTRPGAERALHDFHTTDDVAYTIEHVGPRQFHIVRTETITSEPRPVRSIYDGTLFICPKDGSDLWYYKGRSLFYEFHECVMCGYNIEPTTETGASQ